MRYEPVLFDVSVQRDFFSPGGACYKPSALAAARNIRALFAWARKQRMRVISTVLRVRRDTIGPLADVPHCIEGTDGEKRIYGTVLRSAIDLGMRNVTDLPRNIFDRHQQVIFEMRGTDVFSHSRCERLLTEQDMDNFIVCGAGSAHSIVEGVIGLRSRGKKVVLADDAILDLDDPKADYAWLRMLAKGAVPMPTEDIIAGKEAIPAPRRDVQRREERLKKQ
ncbi:MAG TPA: isochorismatase family protein [Phycisphaerae bacterium]|nr:isochorismatase family protein [Phycisphaerae bacterium]HUU21184.1 isochorismatase family protein [Phycisphaerae bacterium]